MIASADEYDVLVVGGGPAGSSCARRLRQNGFEVCLIDKARFPRDKVCAGWITPPVVEALGIDLEQYGQTRTLQPITVFCVGLIGEPTTHIRYAAPVSYGIRRFEFDEFLLRETGARVCDGEPVQSLERCSAGWVVNDSIRSRVVVGAGGHFCPVARRVDGARRDAAEDVIAAQEVEYRMSARELEKCRIEPDTPELYFYPDLRGYAWCFRKQDYLNIGLGRLGEHNLARYRDRLIAWLLASGRLGCAPTERFRGHAYRLAPQRRDRLVADGPGLDR